MSASSAADVLRGNLTPGNLVFTPVAEGAPSVVGAVRSCDVGLAGLAVHLTADVPPSIAEELHGQRVWVSAHTGERLIAFQGTATATAEGVVDVSGVSAPIQEHRRTLVRAATRLSAHLDVESGPAVDGSTVDLSRGGCRVQLRPGELPDVGSRVHVTIDLSGRPAEMDSEVLRVDAGAGQAVLRFTSLDAEDAARIERHVLSLVV
jgi:hypothetical protein